MLECHILIILVSMETPLALTNGNIQWPHRKVKRTKPDVKLADPSNGRLSDSIPVDRCSVSPYLAEVQGLLLKGVRPGALMPVGAHHAPR